MPAAKEELQRDYAPPRETPIEQKQELAGPKAEPEPTEPAAAAPTPQPAAPARAFDGNWRGLVDMLKLSGMARMLAQNCALEEFDSNRIRLSVPPEHKHLLDNTYQEKLRATLRDHFNKNLQVIIDIGSASMDTPARQINQEKAERQAQAEDSIRNDPFVRDLVESFGATIIPSTIKPAQ